MHQFYSQWLVNLSLNRDLYFINQEQHQNISNMEITTLPLRFIARTTEFPISFTHQNGDVQLQTTLLSNSLKGIANADAYGIPILNDVANQLPLHYILFETEAPEYPDAYVYAVPNESVEGQYDVRQADDTTGENHYLIATVTLHLLKGIGLIGCHAKSSSGAWVIGVIDDGVIGGDPID